MRYGKSARRELASPPEVTIVTFLAQILAQIALGQERTSWYGMSLDGTPEPASQLAKLLVRTTKPPA